MIPAEAQEPHQGALGATTGIGQPKRPTQALSAAVPAAGPAEPRAWGLAWEKIRHPKKPFPSLPCFWSGRRALGRLFELFVLSFPTAASKNILISSSCRRGVIQLRSLLTQRANAAILYVGQACGTWLGRQTDTKTARHCSQSFSRTKKRQPQQIASCLSDSHTVTRFDGRRLYSKRPPGTTSIHLISGVTACQ